MEPNDSKTKIVRVTVRMDPCLHERLRDAVYDLGKGMPPKKRPSIDSVIQQAVREFLVLHAGTTSGGKSIQKTDQRKRAENE